MLRAQIKSVFVALVVIYHIILTVNEMWGSLLLSVSDTSWENKIQQGSEKLTTA